MREIKPMEFTGGYGKGSDADAGIKDFRAKPQKVITEVVDEDPKDLPVLVSADKSPTDQSQSNSTKSELDSAVLSTTSNPVLPQPISPPQT